MKKTILEFLKDEDGLTMIEYAVAGGVLALGAAAAFTTLGNSVKGKIDGLDDAVNGVTAP